tara:strand:+ start:515 stop:721 length:207 start_codon:yes stop_codon:yes gene_type:complete
MTFRYLKMAKCHLVLLSCHRAACKCHHKASKCHHLMAGANLMMAKRRRNLTDLPFALAAARRRNVVLT